MNERENKEYLSQINHELRNIELVIEMTRGILEANIELRKEDKERLVRAANRLFDIGMGLRNEFGEDWIGELFKEE